MGATPQLKLPFPELADQADAPDAFSDLGVMIEGYFYDRTLPTGVTRAPTYYWGSGSALPTSSALRAGDTFTLSGRLMMFVSGTTWAEVDRLSFVSTTDPGAAPDGSVWFKTP